jgi:hypothetical protein
MQAVEEKALICCGLGIERSVVLEHLLMAQIKMGFD